MGDSQHNLRKLLGVALVARFVDKFYICGFLGKAEAGGGGGCSADRSQKEEFADAAAAAAALYSSWFKQHE